MLQNYKLRTLCVYDLINNKSFVNKSFVFYYYVLNFDLSGSSPVLIINIIGSYGGQLENLMVHLAIILKLSYLNSIATFSSHLQSL